MISKELKEFAKKIRYDANKDTQRYLGGLKEDFEDQVKGLADNIVGVQEKLDCVVMDLIEVKSDLRDVKLQININLPNKVDRKHFVQLEQRVRKLENK